MCRTLGSRLGTTFLKKKEGRKDFGNISFLFRLYFKITVTSLLVWGAGGLASKDSKQKDEQVHCEYPEMGAIAAPF